MNVSEDQLYEEKLKSGGRPLTTWTPAKFHGESFHWKLTTQHIASCCELVDQLFSSKAFHTVTENTLVLIPEGLQIRIWGSSV